MITGSDFSLLGQLKNRLLESFHMKDLGSLTYYLGLKVHRSPSSISLNQHKYASDLSLQLAYRRLPLLILSWKYMLRFTKRVTHLLISPYTRSW